MNVCQQGRKERWTRHAIRHRYTSLFTHKKILYSIFVTAECFNSRNSHLCYVIYFFVYKLPLCLLFKALTTHTVGFINIGTCYLSEGFLVLFHSNNSLLPLLTHPFELHVYSSDKQLPLKTPFRHFNCLIRHAVTGPHLLVIDFIKWLMPQFCQTP